MMAWWRVATILARGILHVLLGLLLVTTLFPWCPESTRQTVMRWWSRRLLSIHRVDLTIVLPQDDAAHPDLVGDAMRPDGSGAMLVMNHVSWLDIFVVYSVRPPHFIAKSEISRWPLLGYLVERAGTLFIERGKRHAVREINQRVGKMLREGGLVGLFPEGTVTDGRRLLPFHGNLLQAAIDVNAPVIVAAIRYRDAHGGPTAATLYTAGIHLFGSIVRIARFGPVVAELRLIDALPTEGLARHEVARTAQTKIAAALGLDEVTVSDTGPGTTPDPRGAVP